MSIISLLVLKDPGARYINSKFRNGSSLNIGSTTINLIRIHYMIMKQELESICTQAEIMTSLAKNIAITASNLVHFCITKLHWKGPHIHYLLFMEYLKHI